MTEQQIDFWADVFGRLETVYRIHSEHHVTFDQFMFDPAANERWIHVYFANPALLTNRRGGAVEPLSVFLAQGPALVLLGAQVRDEAQREEMGRDAEQLLRRQQIAANVFDDMNAHAMQEEADKQFERTHVVENRGCRLFEAFRHSATPDKYKTRGAHA